MVIGPGGPDDSLSTSYLFPETLRSVVDIRLTYGTPFGTATGTTCIFDLLFGFVFDVRSDAGHLLCWDDVTIALGHPVMHVFPE